MRNSSSDPCSQGVRSGRHPDRVYVLLRGKLHSDSTDFMDETIGKLLARIVTFLPDVHPGEVLEDEVPVLLPLGSTGDTHAGDACESGAESVDLALSHSDG